MRLGSFLRLFVRLNLGLTNDLHFDGLRSSLVGSDAEGHGLSRNERFELPGLGYDITVMTEQIFLAVISLNKPISALVIDRCYSGCLDRISTFLRSIGLYHHPNGMLGARDSITAFARELVSEPSSTLAADAVTFEAWLLITTTTTC